MAVSEKETKWKLNPSWSYAGFCSCCCCCLFVCWHFNGLIFLAERFTITFCAVSSISVTGGSRNPSLKLHFANQLCKLGPQPSLLAAVFQSILQTSELLTLPGEHCHSQRSSEGQIVHRLLNRELCFSTPPVQSGESEIVAASAPNVQTPGQKLLLRVRPET